MQSVKGKARLVKNVPQVKDFDKPCILMQTGSKLDKKKKKKKKKKKPCQGLNIPNRFYGSHHFENLHYEIAPIQIN